MNNYISHHKGISLPAVTVLLFSIAFLLSGCHSSRKVQKRGDSVRSNTEHVIRKGDKTSEQIIKEAYSWMGTPYIYAGSEKGIGTDCSGMVMRVYECAAGLALPRNSALQAEFCTKLDDSEIRPGDLIFFATGKDPGRISHVGIIIDGELFIHASSKKGVVVSRYDTPYYRRTFKMYGRVPR